MQPKFQIYPEHAGNGTVDTPDPLQWRWRFLAGNGENTANGSEGYAGEGNARRAVQQHCEHVAEVCGVLGPISYPPIEVVDQ